MPILTRKMRNNSNNNENNSGSSNSAEPSLVSRPITEHGESGHNGLHLDLNPKFLEVILRQFNQMKDDVVVGFDCISDEMKQLKENQHMVHQVIATNGKDRHLNQPNVGANNDFVGGMGSGVNSNPLFENFQNMEVPLGLVNVPFIENSPRMENILHLINPPRIEYVLHIENSHRNENNDHVTMNVPIRTEKVLRGNNHRMRNNHHNGVPQRYNNNSGVEIPLDDIDFPRNDGNPKLFMDNGFGNGQENELGHEMAQF